MAIGTRRHKLLTGDDVGSLVRWTVADATARLALSHTADDNGALAHQTDDNSYHILAVWSTSTWVQLGNVTNNTSAASAPTVGDDELDGYEVGDGWINTVTDAVYILTDATAGAAVWVLLGSGSAIWGGITGTLADQTDLQAAIDAAAAAGPVDSVHGRTGAVVSAAGDYDDSEIDHTGIIGTPTYSTVADTFLAMGAVSTVNGGGVITDDTDGTISVSAGEGFIRSTDSDTGSLLSFDFAAEAGANVALVDNDMNYVYVEYNAGAPQVVATITKRTDYNTNILLGTVYREGTTLHVTNHKNPSGNVSTKLTRRFTEVDGLVRATGLVTTETGTRNIANSAGTLWHGMDEVSPAAVDTAVADDFFYYYRDGAGGWTAVSTQTQIDNLQYDDGTGVIATLGASKYGVHWVYRAVDGDLYVVYGQGNYTAATASQATAPATVPPHFNEQHAMLVAKIIIQKSSATFASLELAWTQDFAGSLATDHGGLAGLSDDDHTQYLLADGTRTLSGNLAVAALATIDGRDLSVDGTKLDGIEALADVTDTANVTAAGALMDSEVDADLKTLVLPANTTISAFGATVVDDADAAAARTTLDAARAMLSGAGAPGVSTANGYPLGTTYADTTADEGYILTDNSAGANVWSTATGAGGGGGGAFGFGTWTYAASGPTAGQFFPNSATIGSVTSIVVHQDSVGGMRFREHMARARVGDTLAFISSDGSEGGTYDITSVTEGATTVTYGVTLSNSTGTTYSGDYSLTIQPGATIPVIPEMYGIGSWTYDAATPNTTGEFQPNNTSAAATTSIVFFHDPNEGGRVRLQLAAMGVGSFIALRSNDDSAALHSYEITAVASGATTVTYTVTVRNTTGEDTWSNESAWSLLLSPGPADLVSDGTTAQDAVLFAERTDHVNTPTAGYGELWMDDTGNRRLKLTDGTGADFTIPKVSGTPSNTGIAYFSGTTGLQASSSVFTYSSGRLWLNTAGGSLRIKEAANLSDPGAAQGAFWVRNDTPNTPMFTNDDDVDVPLTRETQRITALWTPAEDIWRTYHENEGWMGDNPWTQSGGSSTSDGTTLDTDPSMDRWDTGIFFPSAARLTSITFAWTANGAHSSHGIHFDVWKQAFTDAMTTTPTKTRILRSGAITVDGTANKLYIKKYTSFDTDVLNALDGINFFATTLDTAGSGVQMRMNINIEYERTS
jgi:hypothetical protein